MPSINTTTSSLHPNTRKPNAYTKNTPSTTAPAAPADAKAPYDSIEISPETRARQKSLISTPAKILNAGSEEHTKFKDLLDTVKQQKSSTLSRITSTLEKKKINLDDLDGTLKIEVGKDGRAIVGGIEDKNLAATIQKALNEDPTLVADIAEYRKNEKTLSAQIKDYTGHSLYAMTQSARGDTNHRIFEEYNRNGDAPPPDFFRRLGFISSMQDIVNADDVAALSFNGNIDFSAEVTVMSDPEGGIREAMDGMFAKVREEFAKLDADLNAEVATIRVDNRGMIQVEGQLSTDKTLNNQGLGIIKRLVQEMLLEVGNNSYGVNLFTAASQGMIDREFREGEAGWGSKVTAVMKGGAVKDIYLSDAGETSEAEEGIQEYLRRASSHIRK